MVEARRDAWLLFLGCLSTGCCGIWGEPCPRTSASEAPPEEAYPYRVSVHGCLEAPEIYVVAGRNDGPEALSEAEFRRDYEPRARRVLAHVDTPKGTILGQQGDQQVPYVTFWIRQPRNATFLAREAHVTSYAFEPFAAVDFRCLESGEVR